MKFSRQVTGKTFATVAAAFALTALASVSQSAMAAGTLRIAMTAADIPRTSGQPDQGYEGNRFTGITMYDSLVQWDLSKANASSGIIPDLALSWDVDAKDHTKWIFKLRPGVKFHDGSAFNADAVVWNVDKVLDKNAPQYDPAQAAATVSRMPTLKSARKVDDMTVEFTTTEPDSFLPYNLVNLYMASPAHWQQKYDAAGKNGNAAWTAFARDASGTGPFKMSKFVPRERLELVPNPDYWDAKRRSKLDRVVLLPMPEASARTAALLSNQVDWIEAPAPDAADQIKARGFKIYQNEQPHVWPWQLSFAEGSPWLDKRVRHAANLCVNRNDLKVLLHGMMTPAEGIMGKDSPWFGKPTFQEKYDPAAAKKLMQEAGYSAAKPAQVKVITSASGSGQMQPLPMNEFIQQNLKQCFFDVKIDVVEWNTLFSSWRLGAKDPSAHGANAINVTAATMDPYFAMVRFASTEAFPPKAQNWGFYGNKETDELVKKARTTFDPKARDQALARLHEAMVNDPVFLFVAHDVGPRAISAKVKGVVQPKSWFIDIATMSM